MSNIKEFKVSQPFSDNYVELDVDLAVLTPSVAAEINDFVSDPDERIQAEGGDVVRAAIRMFGTYAIRYFFHDGGVSLSRPIGQGHVRATQDVLSYYNEGWPDFEQLGIVITEAYVEVPAFDDVMLEEI